MVLCCSVAREWLSSFFESILDVAPRSLDVLSETAGVFKDDSTDDYNCCDCC